MAIPIIISNCGAASGATFSGNCIFAVNGFDCIIKNITEGCTYNSFRPYRFLSSDCNCLLATEGNCGNKIFILDNCFNEIGSICPPCAEGTLLTAYITCGRKLLLTYRKKIVIANGDGSIGETIATSNRENTDFIAAFPYHNGLLIAFNDGYRDTIQYRSCNGSISNCILPRCVNIQSFTQSDDGTVYGLFAKGYPYRYLIPVIIDGRLNCVTEECFGTNLCGC
ncbi:MAG: hypothetical protein E7597_00340 [Ruminococcaceae bacterium]|nr:hypothetical protein [Oscillospiraceae bacterium]